MIIDVHVHSTKNMGKRLLLLLRKECLRNGVSLCLLASLGVETWSRYPAPKK